MAAEKKRLSEQVVERAAVTGRRYMIADTDIPGFWLVVTKTGKKSFVLRYRVGGGRAATIREPKIGDWPAMKAAKARSIASDWFAEVRLGGDPGGARQELRAAPTMATLFDRYLTDHARPTKKASSFAEDVQLLKDYLRPAFDKRKVHEVTRADVDRFHKGLSHKPYRANRALALLSKAMNIAEVWGWRPDGSNPVRHVRKFAEKRRERFLSPAELGRLGAVLRQAERDGFLILPPREGVRDVEVSSLISRHVVAAIRLLMLTGARKSEILGLRWAWIDMAAGRAHLPDSKTGFKVVILPPAALAELARLPRLPDNPHVIVGGKPGAALVNLKDPWAVIRKCAGIEDVRIHDLRHSFASVGAAGGASLPILGALLGHSQPSTTARYAHLADDPLQAAAAEIGGRIVAAMGDDDLASAGVDDI